MNTEVIFNEYFELLKLMTKNKDLAPVYIGEIRVSFKKGIDHNNRRRNVVKRYMIDIAQMEEPVAVSGSFKRASIYMYVCTTRNKTKLIIARKRRTNLDRY